MVFYAPQRDISYDPINCELHVSILTASQYSKSKKKKVLDGLNMILFPELYKLEPIESVHGNPEMALPIIDNQNIFMYKQIYSLLEKRRSKRYSEYIFPFSFDMVWTNEIMYTSNKFRLETITPEQFEKAMAFVDKSLNSIYEHYGSMFYEQAKDKIRREIESDHSYREKRIKRAIKKSVKKYPKELLIARDMLSKFAPVIK